MGIRRWASRAATAAPRSPWTAASSWASVVIVPDLHPRSVFRTGRRTARNAAPLLVGRYRGSRRTPGPPARTAPGRRSDGSSPTWLRPTQGQPRRRAQRVWSCCRRFVAVAHRLHGLQHGALVDFLRLAAAGPSYDLDHQFPGVEACEVFTTHPRALP